jgi:hypothetical protein
VRAQRSAYRERIQTELACFLERETALVNRVVSDGFNRYPE